MPWEIREEDGRYCVYREGEADPITCHDSKEDAEAHLAALYANEDAKAYDVRSVGGKFYVFRAGDESPLAGFADREQAAQLLTLLTGGRDADAPNAVKVVGEGLLGGYGVVFTGPEFKDLYGEYFTPETNLWTDYYPEVPALYHHGLDTAVGKSVVGVARFKYADDVGAWYETQLNLRSKYEQLIYELAKAGALGYSSGTVSHLAEVGPDGRIASWPVVEMTTTPTPAMPYVTQVEAVRSAYKSAGLKVPAQLSEGKQKPENQTEVKNMDILEFIRKIAMYTNFYIEGDVESLIEQVLAEANIPTDAEVAGMGEEELAEVAAKALAGLKAAVAPGEPEGGLTEEAVMEMVTKALADFKAAGADVDDGPDGADDTPGEAPTTTPPPTDVPKPLTTKDVEAMIKKAVMPLAAQLAKPKPRGGAMTAPPAQSGRRLVEREEYTKAFVNYARLGWLDMDTTDRDLLHRARKDALVEGLDSAGGYLAPAEFVDTLIQKRAAYARIRQLVEVIQTSAAAVDIPAERYDTDNIYTSPVRRQYVGEKPNSAEETRAAEPSFGMEKIFVHTILSTLLVSRDLLADAVFDVGAYISDKMAEANVLGDENDIINGDGNGKPLGILNTAAVIDGCLPSGASDGIEADALIDVTFDLPEQYHNGAMWFMNARTAGVISKMKNLDEEYYWPDIIRQGGLISGSQFLGFPVVLTQFMPNIAEGAYPVLFGNLRYAYTLIERLAFTLERLTEVYRERNMMGFLMEYRTGGQVVAPWALRLMKISAT